MIGDVMRIQRLRLTPAACSLTQFFRVFYGQRTSDMDVLRIANDRVKLYNFKLVAYTDIWSEG